MSHCYVVFLCFIVVSAWYQIKLHRFSGRMAWSSADFKRHPALRSQFGSSALPQTNRGQVIRISSWFFCKLRQTNKAESPQRFKGHNAETTLRKYGEISLFNFHWKARRQVTDIHVMFAAIMCLVGVNSGKNWTAEAVLGAASLRYMQSLKN